MSLSNEQKKRYRAIGHSLKPVVTVAGNGLSKAVLTEIDRALADHELIKIKLVIEDKEARKQTVQSITNKTDSIIVQEIGKIVLILRASKRPNPKLSNLLR